MNKKYTLLLDLGNTNLKLALWNKANDQIEETIWINKSLYKKKSKMMQVLKTKCKNIQKNIEDGLLISVVPSAEKNICEVIQTFFQIDVLRWNYKLLGLAKNSQKEKMGEDLIALMIASNEISPKNSIIISAGTATVVMVIYQKNIEGIWIAPGWELSAQILKDKTDLIEVMPDYNEKDLPKNSAQAIGAAIIYQQIGFLEKSIQKSNRKFNCEFNILLTGGNADYIEKNLQLAKVQKKKDLMWIGMKNIYQLLLSQAWS